VEIWDGADLIVEAAAAYESIQNVVMNVALIKYPTEPKE
jgi:hypothetical protein